jgi:hypothetical protein
VTYRTLDPAARSSAEAMANMHNHVRNTRSAVNVFERAVDDLTLIVDTLAELGVILEQQPGGTWIYAIGREELGGTPAMEAGSLGAAVRLVLHDLMRRP